MSPPRISRTVVFCILLSSILILSFLTNLSLSTNIPITSTPKTTSIRLSPQQANVIASMNAILTPTSISYLQSIFQPIIIEQIKAIKLDDIQQHIDTPIGGCDVTLTNLQLNQFDIKDISVSIAEGQGMIIKVSNAFAQLALNWSYRRTQAPHFSDQGTADAAVGSNTQLVMTAKVVPMGNTTTLDITLPSFDMDIFKFDLKMHGGASWLYNIFIASFRRTIVRGIQQSLHDNVSNIVQQQAREVLATINLNFEIFPGLAADFSFTGMAFHTTGVESENLALVKAAGKPVFPDAPPALPTIYQPRANDMVQVFLADTFFNSAGFSIQQMELIKYIIGNNLLPSWSPLKLTTGAFCFFMPKVCELYPTSMEMQIALVSGSAPHMKFDPAVGVVASLDLAAQFQVINGTQVLDTLFSIDAIIVLDTAISVKNGTTVTAQFTTKEVSVIVKDSKVGDIDVSILSNFMGFVFNFILLPLMNIFGATGLELPSVQGLTLLDPFVAVLDRMLVISSNFKYVPPTE